jgi:hypothetical protein
LCLHLHLLCSLSHLCGPMFLLCSLSHLCDRMYLLHSLFQWRSLLAKTLRMPAKQHSTKLRRAGQFQSQQFNPTNLPRFLRQE